ncbi:putative flippase GtrA [Kitasatospora gansuensis]|uniref:Putative flippase GtrA n=1 Tax=Kitasatospora gansuensis TaxID=258050 RepID=A0A7W7SE99_9ACTN|nr:GtrA family protein [Kitasatospora gansuensis]MBB4948910.1 putative flippase GtrA [Kitasatospora gansuensis]
MTSTTGPKASLTQKLRSLSREVTGFAVIGLVGVVVNAGVFWVCLQTPGVIGSLAGFIATAVAIGTNYIGYRYWLYADRDAASRKREITLFLIFSGIGMLIENGILAFSVHVLGYSSHAEQLIAKNVVGLAAGTVFRFFSYRTWVFKALPELAEPATVPAPAEAALQPQYAK